MSYDWISHSAQELPITQFGVWQTICSISCRKLAVRQNIAFWVNLSEMSLISLLVSFELIVGRTVNKNVVCGLLEASLCSVHLTFVASILLNIELCNALPFKCLHISNCSTGFHLDESTLRIGKV